MGYPKLAYLPLLIYHSPLSNVHQKLPFPAIRPRATKAATLLKHFASRQFPNFFFRLWLFLNKLFKLCVFITGHPIRLRQQGSEHPTSTRSLTGYFWVCPNGCQWERALNLRCSWKLSTIIPDDGGGVRGCLPTIIDARTTTNGSRAINALHELGVGWTTTIYAGNSW